MRRVTDHGPTYYQFDSLQTSDRVQHGVFTRLGGVSPAPFASLNVGGTVGDDPDAVRENMTRIYDALDVPSAQACTVWQVHSADVVVADHPAVGRRWLARADGMVTDKPNLPLTMRFADCVPILFHDPVQHVVGIAHAGWRGTVRGVAAAVVRAMQRSYGSQPADIHAAIGPSIGPDHFQVGPEVVTAIQEHFGNAQDLVRYADDGTTYVDLWRANALDLQRAGVRQIDIAGICTVETTSEFFSHRGERGKTGRFCAVIALR